MNGLWRYVIYKKYFAEKEQLLQDLTLINTKRYFFKKLNSFRVRSKNDRKTTKQIRVLRCRKCLRGWKQAYDEAVEETEERQLANELFARHMLRKLH